jgi:uncharacterized protein YidB (DUF937 family)
MNFLEGVVGQVSSLLGPNSNAPSGLVGSVMNLVNSQPGGLAGLVQQFKDKGLGEAASSWVGTGPNLAITGQQIQQVLGNQQLQQLASQHGIDLNDVSNHLAQILPSLVDKLTPNGTLPSN